MLAVAKRTIGLEAVDCDEIVGLLAKAVLVPFLDRNILHRGRAERVERSAGRLHARGHIFEPGLVRRDFYALPWPGRATRLLDALPALPREFVIVPHADERPARSGVLKIGIGEIALIDDAVAVERQRVMEVADLAAVRNAPDIVDDAVVARLHLVRIFDHLIDEVAKMEHEAELVGGCGALVFEDHPAIGVELAFVDALAADEGEVDGARIGRQRRSARAADAAAVARGIGEAVPIGMRGLQPADEDARGPVGGGRHRRRRLRDDAAELRVLRDLDRQQLAGAGCERAAGPQDHAGRVGIARRDALRIKVARLAPVGA